MRERGIVARRERSDVRREEREECGRGVRRWRIEVMSSLILE